MTPERAAELVTKWVRLYTQELPQPVAQRRVEEVVADLDDHIAHERATGKSGPDIARSILSRMVRGVLADMSWRRRVRSSEGELVKRVVALVATTFVVVIGVGAMLLGETGDAPGLVLIGVFFIAGTIAFKVSPGLRRRSRALGVIVGAAALWVLVVSIAGWLENVA